jgi:hypothetical protein
MAAAELRRLRGHLQLPTTSRIHIPSCMVRRAAVGRDAGVCHADGAAGRPRPTLGRPGVGEGERRASACGRDAAMVRASAGVGGW